MQFIIPARRLKSRGGSKWGHMKNATKSAIVTGAARGIGKAIALRRAAHSFTPFGGASYAASKTGLLGLSRQLAHELAPFRVRVKAVCPGGTDTPLARTLRTPGEMERAVQNLPLGRFG